LFLYFLLRHNFINLK